MLNALSERDISRRARVRYRPGQLAGAAVCGSRCPQTSYSQLTRDWRKLQHHPRAGSVAARCQRQSKCNNAGIAPVQRGAAVGTEGNDEFSWQRWMIEVRADDKRKLRWHRCTADAKQRNSADARSSAFFLLAPQDILPHLREQRPSDSAGRLKSATRHTRSSGSAPMLCSGN